MYKDSIFTSYKPTTSDLIQENQTKNPSDQEKTIPTPTNY